MQVQFPPTCEHPRVRGYAPGANRSLQVCLVATCCHHRSVGGSVSASTAHRRFRLLGVSPPVVKKHRLTQNEAEHLDWFVECRSVAFRLNSDGIQHTQAILESSTRFYLQWVTVPLFYRPKESSTTYLYFDLTSGVNVWVCAWNHHPFKIGS